MKKMKVVLVAVLALLLSGANINANAQFFKFWKKKEVVKAETDTVKKGNKAEQKYKKLLKNANTQEGLFKVHKVKNKDNGHIKFYFEIPKSLLGKDLLMSSTVTKSSSSFVQKAGFMPTKPFMFSFEADNEKVFLTYKPYNIVCNKEEEIYNAFKRNNINAIWKAYKIEAFSKDSSSYVIDMSGIFTSSQKEITPFSPGDPMLAMFGIRLNGPIDKNRSKITEVKSFEKNVKIRSLLTTTLMERMQYSAEVVRNIVLLPDNVMMPRLSDDRVGFFEIQKRFYTSYEPSMLKNFITKWNLQVATKDIAKYKKGELVEPTKPIVWYVDPAIPSKYRPFVKQGIEDWQEAFEEIGFKNAIIAKDYPTKEEDPNFDPDDINYNCYKYMTTAEENSMGPSWIDPRSGEIICGSVYFYSNVVDLLQEWRFVQTAQVDPRVRTEKMNLETLGESLRYVAAHEVGHTLGLMHNFLSSAAYPVEKLRDAEFTQKYGTTPSIMDYARYNYVAQPGDKGLKLTPPKLGLYDKFAIKYGYKPILGAIDPDDEYKTLNSWLLEHKDNKMYTYINPYTHRTMNPDCQTEAIGDDAIKASYYGIKNLKYITEHLTQWIKEDGKKYDNLEKYYKAIESQFKMYIFHCLTYVGGEYTYATVEGDGIDAHKFVGDKKQKEAINFIIKQVKDYSNWMGNEEIIKHFKNPKMWEIKNRQGWLLSLLFERPFQLGLIKSSFSKQKDKFTYAGFNNYMFNKVWGKTIKGYRLNDFDKVFQTAYINKLLSQRKEGKLELNSRFLADTDSKYIKNIDENNLAFSLPFVENPEIASNAAAMLFKVYDLVKSAKNRGSYSQKSHYHGIYMKLKLALKE